MAMVPQETCCYAHEQITGDPGVPLISVFNEADWRAAVEAADDKPLMYVSFTSEEKLWAFPGLRCDKRPDITQFVAFDLSGNTTFNRAAVLRMAERNRSFIESAWAQTARCQPTIESFD